ncbi:hypothetical protein E6H36_06290 [Candidatus Bathyarchaeota archaeon]|nr:MAG: hypothetical protein E6H36_06290 [Candidatus Bathyarchaeota archaeon]
MRRIVLACLLALTILTGSASLSQTAHAVSWSSSVALPNVDPNTNDFPNLLQTSNSSVGQGAVWMVWEKATQFSLGKIYLMTHNRYGWSGATSLMSDSFDNIAPALGELANGTIITVWSRGTGITGTYDLYYMGFNGVRWTTASPLVTAAGDDFTPALTRTSDGKVWLVWSRSTSTNGGGDVFYKTYNGTWSMEQQLIGTSNEEKFPSVTQTSDGRVWVVYESNVQGGNPQLWYRTFDGAVWSKSTNLTNTTNMDKYPSIVQDRSGALWVFFSRELSTGDPNDPFQWNTFYKNSTNAGTTWGADTQIAFQQFTNSDQYHPSLIQSLDETLWVVYSSDQPIGNPYNTLNLYLIQSAIIPGHDVAVTNIRVSPLNPRQGETPTIYVTITNAGEYSENAQVRVSVNSTQIGSTTIPLSSKQVATVTFPWNSTGFPMAAYQVTAILTPVSSEVITFNNVLSSNFLLTSVGDTNRDGRVNILDLAIIGLHFGSTTGMPNYLPDADLNHDGVTDIRDLTLCAIHFGEIA